MAQVIRGLVKEGAHEVGRMSASEPFDGTRTTGGAIGENPRGASLTTPSISVNPNITQNNGYAGAE